MWPTVIAKSAVLNVSVPDVCPEPAQSRSTSDGSARADDVTDVKRNGVDGVGAFVADAEPVITVSTNTNTDVRTVRTPTSNLPCRARCRGSRCVLHPVFAPLEHSEAASNNEDTGEFNVKVQIRTRENSMRSPLVATPTHQMGAGLSNAWSPYKSGSTSPLVATPVSMQKELSSPVCTPAGLMEPIPPSVVHRVLYGKCRFIPFPVFPSYEAPVPPQGSFPLFIGQVRFETTAAELMWLFHRTCGACPLTIEGRGSGCIILHLKSESDRTLVRQLHKSILFDIGGVWYARSLEEVESMRKHVALDGPYLSKQAKLPRDSMVVEDIKVDNAEMPGYHPYYYQNPHQMQSFVSHNPWGNSSNARSTPGGPMYNSTSSSPLLPPLTLAPSSEMVSSHRATGTAPELR